MKASEFITEAVKQRLDPKCWKGKHKEGTKIKGGVRVNNCVANESVNESELAIADYGRKVLTGLDKLCQAIKARRPEVFHQLDDVYQSGGVGEWIVEALKLNMDEFLEFSDKFDEVSDAPIIDFFYAWNEGRWDQFIAPWQAYAAKVLRSRGQVPALHEQGIAKELSEEFDLIESIIETLAERNQVDAEAIWEDLESLTDDELYVFATTTPVMEDWQKVNKKDKTDGMSKKAVSAYRREHPGSKLKTAVTTKPSKLKKGSKASKRRKSYCSRSKGQMKMHNISCAKTPDKAICKARRRWNC